MNGLVSPTKKFRCLISVCMEWREEPMRFQARGMVGFGSLAPARRMARKRLGEARAVR